MTKTFVIGSIMVASLIALAPAFADTTSTSTGSTSSSVVTKIACIGAAVSVREKAIDSGLTTYTAAINAAYAARATALADAYATSTPAGMHAGVKLAWSTFSDSFKSAKLAWSSTKSGAWSQFHAAVLACKAPSGTSDTTDYLSSSGL